ncbi:hypothetical protein J7438_22520, partial [Thalassotalea sp. G20_0]|uniref:hypothetical protein n=1 Tax=Thalassotalea sp. G20_0 TaxID=2821093 RepID=UPI001ADBACD4
HGDTESRRIEKIFSSVTPCLRGKKSKLFRVNSQARRLLAAKAQAACLFRVAGSGQRAALTEMSKLLNDSS